MKISESVWENIKDSEGNPYKFRKIHQDQYDLVVVYADPRVFTTEFKIVLEEFKRLPVTNLRIGIIIMINTNTNTNTNTNNNTNRSCSY